MTALQFELSDDLLEQRGRRLAEMVADRLVEQPAPTPWLSVPQAAEYLGLSEQAITSLLKRGAIPAYRPNGRDFQPRRTRQLGSQRTRYTQQTRLLRRNRMRTPIVRADQLRREPVEWLWEERIPRGMISLVAGLPGVGKSLFGYFLAAETSQTAGVIYSTYEESLRKTARARLEAAGANLERVLFWNPELPRDTNILADEIEANRAELVVLDPIAAHLSVSIYNDQDVRRALSPLKIVAEETNAAIVLVSHTVKSVARGAHPMDAIGGSGGGLRAAARIAYLFGRNPDDSDQLLLACVKSNIGPEPRTFAFELDLHEFDDVGAVAFVQEMSELDASSSEQARLMLDTSNPASTRAEKRSQATEFLINYLRHGARPVSELKEDAKQYGHSWATIRRASDELGVIKPTGGPNATWALPQGLLAELTGGGDGE